MYLGGDWALQVWCGGFDSHRVHQEFSVAQLVEQEPAHGQGPNAAGQTKPLVRVQPGNPNSDTGESPVCFAET